MKGRILKPTRPTLLRWIEASLQDFDFEDHVFFKTVFKDPKGIYDEKTDKLEIDANDDELIIEGEEIETEDLDFI